MTVAMPHEAFAAPRAALWRTHLSALALVAAALLLLFHRDLGDLVHIWWTSTTFGHCLFIVPVVAWLVWQRRAELARLTPQGWAPGLAIVAAGGFAWLVGEAASVALARHVGLVTMLDGAVVTLLGPSVARGLLFPLGYLYFAVPFGDGLEPPLQDLTVAMVMPMLHAVGIPASVDGVLIHAGRYWFEVAEACSGAKFVLAMIAYGALVANLCFRSWRRRAVFMGVCLVVPVLANGLRAFGTVYAANLTSVERATGFDHIVYGWVFFGLVMALVMAAGWRWFDRAPDDAAFDPERVRVPARALALLPAAALTLAIALAFPAWSNVVASRPTALPAHLDLPAVPGWQRTGLDTNAPWAPHYPAADHFLLGRYARAGEAVDVSVAAFARQREGAELIAFGTGVLREGDRWIRVADEAPIAGGRVMRIVAQGRDGSTVERVVATWYRVGDTVTADGRRVKMATLAAHLGGGDPTAVALHASAVVRPGIDARAAIARFVAAAGGPRRLTIP
jgi:exosortase A